MANGVPNREPFAKKLRVPESLTFDGVLLHPMESRVEPDDADVSTRVSGNVELNTPILLAVMDTATESGMAIGMAREGSLGVLHRSMNAEQMVCEIGHVKRADKLVIRHEDVVTANPSQTISEVGEMMEHAGVSGAPVIDDDDVVLGIIFDTDIRPYLKVGEFDGVGEVTTDEVITTEHDVTARDALELMYDHKIEHVSIIDDDSHLVGLAMTQGILQRHRHENTARDDDGRFVCGTVVGPFDDERVQMAGDAGADVIFIGRAHTYNLNVTDTVCGIKESAETDVIVGSTGTREAVAELVDLTDDIKAGIGPSSIYTTHIVSGSSIPQISAVTRVADVAADHDIPAIADGDTRYSDDAIEAVVTSADVVMLGPYFVGIDEAPGRVIAMNGKKYKQYRGVGSVDAMQSSGVDRYLEEDNEDEEYVSKDAEATTPYKGSPTSELHQLVGGMQSGMGYVGAETIPEVKERARFTRVSVAGQTEGHLHDVMITDEAPNYNPSK